MAAVTAAGTPKLKTFELAPPRPFKDSVWPHLPSIFKDARQSHEYRPEEFIGSGAFGRVYRVVDCKNSGQFAAKVLDKQNFKNPQYKKRLINEIEVMRKIPPHHHIVNFRACFEDTAFVYIVMELCTIKGLDTMFKTRRQLTEPEVRYFMNQLVEAVAHMHKHRVIHRDLKFANILLTEPMQVKVADFGLSAMLLSDKERKKSFLGTPNFLAPEVVNRPREGHSYEVDIWALGIVMYSMLYSKPPFHVSGGPKQAQSKALYQKITHEDIRFPETPYVSLEAKQLILALLCKDPEKRPSASRIRDLPFFTNYEVIDQLPRSVFYQTPTIDERFARPKGSTRVPNDSRHVFNDAKVDAAAQQLQHLHLPNDPGPHHHATYPNPIPHYSGQKPQSAGTPALPPLDIPAHGVAPHRGYAGSPVATAQPGARADPYSPAYPKPPRSAHGPLPLPPQGHGLSPVAGTHSPRDAAPVEMVHRGVGPTDAGLTGSGNGGERKCPIMSCMEQRINRFFGDVALAKRDPDAVRRMVPDPSLLTPKVFMSKWIDLSSKYGLGYELTNHSYGVHFNDNTTLLLLPDQQRIEHLFYDPTKSQKSIKRESFTLDSYPTELKKKVTLLLQFRRYMRKKLNNMVPERLSELHRKDTTYWYNLSSSNGDGQSDNDPALCSCGAFDTADNLANVVVANAVRRPDPADTASHEAHCRLAWTNRDPAHNLLYLNKFIRTKYAAVFRISHGVLQLNFMHDHSKLILQSRGEIITYITEHDVRTYSLNNVHELLDHTEILKRLKYTRDVLGLINVRRGGGGGEGGNQGKLNG
ncbi:Cell cycle serine/threonine-protein kinase cdc5/MSD2 [Tieghemiomyces parasiticus]|uniref:Serine/threonine-protein kinase n=1 Tax=Tieghemiomyces parasiticus TaxID=78921 RepID=A0A9W7ZQ91_9FUNG|nr:Cell cycle serine/threonine-protein kinase cdc5/MSD2 [Tieghemiomyces parasiticus]